MRADLHAHTTASADSAIAPETLVRTARARGLSAVAVTDHDTAKAWRRVAAEGRRIGFPVILGQEVKTREGGRRTGEVIGLFLTDPLRGGTVAETLDQIRGQGGLAVAPHPCDSMRSSLGEGAREHKDGLVALETVNGRSYLARYNANAASLAQELGLAAAGGSDAHFPSEVGLCWTEWDDGGLDGLRRALSERRTAARGRRAGAWCHVASVLRLAGLVRQM